MTNAPLNTADYEYASPERIPELPVNAPQQMPKRFMILLLKGCSTEFTDCKEQAHRIISRCWLRNNGNAGTYLIFKYSDALECYHVIPETEL